MEMALEVRAGGQEGEPKARASGPLLPLEEYQRIGEARKVPWTQNRTNILSLLWKARKP